MVRMPLFECAPTQIPCARWIGEIGHDLDFMRATCRHPRMLRMVESFLGGPVKLPTRNRGLYTVWPRRAPARQLGPHLDNQSEELLATTYLGPVDAADGGFTLWPRSHKSMWCASHEQINWVPNGTRDQVRSYFLVFVPTIREIRDFYREM
eukprot:SAG31_NODE_414_length_15953_cov_2.982528_11_plen_151_part_00